MLIITIAMHHTVYDPYHCGRKTEADPGFSKGGSESEVDLEGKY